MKKIVLLGFVLCLSMDAFAWGRRGHALVNETAAILLADRKLEGAEMLKDRSFDLGYLANVPDLIWKKPETYKQESINHFMDMEIFERAIPKDKLADAFAMSRAEFEKTYPQVEEKAGRSFWRIREMMAKLETIAAELKKTDLTQEKRFAVQLEWLNTAGVMGHYVGDLAQPLHVTENYDGQMTDQKGVHRFFEDVVVDEFGPGELEAAVYKKAKTLKNDLTGKDILVLLEDLATTSNKNIPDLLKIDKKIGRTDVKKAREAYRKMIIDRMALGSLYLAELWSRRLGFKYDGDKFYDFEPSPKFIPSGK